MLSYRHSYHAGNFADVLKHIVLIEILQHFIKKDKAFSYIDTHSGAGLYHLQSTYTAKLQEYRNGIGKLYDLDWPELATYQSVIQAVNPDKSLTFYPGSPLLALHLMRQQDRAWLFELHPEDTASLITNMRNDRRVRVQREDGLKGVLSLVPPVSRRGLVLIDPSYEIKSDYESVVTNLIKAYKKFTTGTYALWYPVVERGRILRIEQQLKQSGIKHIQRFELGLTVDSDSRGMTASGMIVLNPPWQLMATMSALLPKLVSVLDESGQAYYCSDVLATQ